MSSDKQIAQLSAEEVAGLLRLNYFKIGLTLTPGSREETKLVNEISTYQRNLRVYSFSDMFSKFAAGDIRGQEKLKPVFTGYFVAQLRHAFFDTINGYKKKSPAVNPNRTAWLYRRQYRDSAPKSIGELIGRAI